MTQHTKTQRLQIRKYIIKNGSARQSREISHAWKQTIRNRWISSFLWHISHKFSQPIPGCEPAPDTAEVHRELDPSATCKCAFLMWPGCFQHLGVIDCLPALLAARTFHKALAFNMASKFPLTLAIQQLRSPTPFWGRTRCIPYGPVYGRQAYMKPWKFIAIMHRTNSTFIFVEKTQLMLRVLIDYAVTKSSDDGVVTFSS